MCPNRGTNMTTEIKKVEGNELTKSQKEGVSEALSIWITSEKEKIKEKIKGFTDLKNEDNVKAARKLAKALSLDYDSEDLKDFDKFKSMIRDHIGANPKKIDILFSNCGKFGVKFIDLINKEHLSSAEARKSFLGFCKDLLDSIDGLGIDEIDEKVCMLFDEVTKRKSIKVTDFETAKDAIKILTINTSKEVFFSLDRILAIIKNLEFSEEHKDKSIGKKTKEFIGGALGINSWAECITKDKVTDLYNAVLNGLKDALENIRDRKLIYPLVEDRDKVLNIMQFFSTRKNLPPNIDNSVLDSFENERNVLIDTLISQYGRIIKITFADTAFLENYEQSFLNSLKKVVVNFITCSPDETLRIQTINNLGDCGYITIDILKGFLFDRPTEEDFGSKIQWQKEKAVQINALEQFNSLLNNENYKKYHDQIINILTDLTTNSKTDTALREKSLEILMKHLETQYSNYEKIIEMKGDDTSNQEIIHKFYHLLLEKLCNEQSTEKLNSFIVDKGKTIFRNIFLREDEKLEKSEIKRLIDKFKSDTDKKITDLFYDILKDLQNSSTIQHILKTVINKKDVFDNGTIANIIEKANSEKTNTIIKEIADYFDGNKTFSKENVERLLDSIYNHNDFEKLDTQTLNRVSMAILNRLQGSPEEDILFKPVFSKILSKSKTSNDVKKIIIDKYLDDFVNLRNREVAASCIKSAEESSDELFYEALTIKLSTLTPTQINNFLSSGQSNYLIKLLLRQATKPEAKRRIIEKFKEINLFEKENLEIFYDVVHKSEDNEIVKYSLENILCKNKVFDNVKMANIIKDAKLSGKIGVIINGIDTYVKEINDDVFFNKFDSLMLAMIGQFKKAEVDIKKKIDLLIEHVVDKIKASDGKYITIMIKPMFYKLLTSKDINIRTKKTILDVNIDYRYKNQDGISSVKDFVKDCFLSEEDF